MFLECESGDLINLNEVKVIYVCSGKSIVAKFELSEKSIPVVIWEGDNLEDTKIKFESLKRELGIIVKRWHG